MTDHLKSLAARLCEAENPHDMYDWEQKDGYYVQACRVSRDDVPDLIKLVGKWSDVDWPQDDLGLDVDLEEVEMLPVTAWRSLADLKASEAVKPLIDFLVALEDEHDDWASSELPHVFGKIGAVAITELDQLANDTRQSAFTRMIAAEALQCVAEYHPVARDEVIACLAALMANASEGDIYLNSVVLDGLVSLQGAEAAEAIERAFAANRLDVGLMGDWEDVRRALGVEGLRLEMPKHPYNSIEQFSQRMGAGIFSDRRVFDMDGEITDAEQAYYERAENVFSKSQEAEQVIEQCGGLGWFQCLLSFGVKHLGEIVDTMTQSSVHEFLLDFVPRKVSVDADQAAEMVLELTKFWEYVDRVYELPAAKSIVEWLKTDGLVGRLEAELSDPANFGTAKSFFMAGKAAGYDMTSEVEVNQFVTEYNQALLESQSEADSAPSFSTIRTSQQRIGRNDPCPCGSGKKYKKCCLRH